MKTLVNETEGPGVKEVTWSGTNQAGRQLASGVYFYRLEAKSINNAEKGFVHVRKMMLMK